MTTNFEIAPPRHNTDWDKCLAFSLPPAVGLAVAVAYFENAPRLGMIVGAVIFVGTFISAWPLARSPRGYLRLTETELQLGSGWMQSRVALGDLDLAAARLGPPPPDLVTVTSLVTHPAITVCIPRRGPGEIVVSVVEPDALLHTLHRLAPRFTTAP